MLFSSHPKVRIHTCDYLNVILPIGRRVDEVFEIIIYGIYVYTNRSLCRDKCKQLMLLRT